LQVGRCKLVVANEYGLEREAAPGCEFYLSSGQLDQHIINEEGAITPWEYARLMYYYISKIKKDITPMRFIDFLQLGTKSGVARS
jgi:hypothetical protein